MNLTVLLVLTATLVSCHGMPAAPSSLAISGVTSESFTAIFDSVSSATSYEVSYTAQHDSTNTGSVNITANFTTVTGLASNLNYDVRVRAFQSDVAGNYSTTVRARTAPSGSSILQVITTPTFITVFLEETPGATKWEVEYSGGGSTSTIIVPDDVPSMTNYIAIISSLLPNTSYTLRARVSQINGGTNYNVAQSPYGNSTEITTDKVSAFGRVQLITRSYTSTDNTNTALKTELLNAYQSVASNVVDVSIVELENDGSGNILCHHEIVLNDQTFPPNISALTLSNATLYNGSSVRFDVGESFDVQKFGADFEIQFAGSSSCPDISSTSRVWTLYDKNGNISLTELPNLDNNIASLSTVTFADAGVTSSSSTVLLPFSQNTIYGIKQEYLIKTCPDGDNSTLYYNRVHGSNGAFTNVEANNYTIIHTTDVQSIGSIAYTRAASGTQVTLNVPANLIRRAFQYNFDVAGSVTTLSQSDLDSSSTYLVSLTGLPQDADSDVTIEVRARAANSSIYNASRIVTVTTDTNECSVGFSNCDTNASCENFVGNFTCTCNIGYTGNDTSCSDTDECSTDTDNCHTNATCTNTEGSYTCTCNDGFTGNGTTCNDIDECTDMIDNCHENATCFNTEGSFLCNCASGFSGSGTICTDIDECLDDILNSCHENAACINLAGSLDCTCNRGFSGDGLVCRDIDECDVFSDSCHESSNCSNTFGGFGCYCGNRLLISSFNCLDAMDCNNYTCEERSLAWIAAIVVPVLAIILIVIIIIKCRKVKGAYDPKQVNKNTILDMSTLQANEQNSQNARSNVKGFYDLVDAQKQFDSNAGQYGTPVQGNDADVEANSRHSKKGSYDLVEAERQFDLNRGRYKTCLEDFDADEKATSPSSKKDSNDPDQTNKNTASNVSGSYDLVEAEKQFNLKAGQHRSFQQGNDVDVVVDDVDVVVNSHRSQKGSYDLVEAQRQFDLNRGRYETCLEDFDADEKATSPSSKDTLDSGVENLAFDRADESLDSGMESEQSDESMRNSSRKGSYDVLEAQQRFNMGTKKQTKDSSIKQQTAIKPGSSPKNNGDETDSESSGKGFYDVLKAQKEFNHGEDSSEYLFHPDQRSNTPHQGEQAEHVVKKGSYDVLKAQQDFNLQISDSVERNFHPDDKEVAVKE